MPPSKKTASAPPAAKKEPNSLLAEIATRLLVAELTGTQAYLGVQDIKKIKLIVSGCINAAKDIVTAASE